jgi:hypothetical protein
MLLIRTDVVESDREIIQDRGSTPHSAGLGWADIANNIGQTQCQLRWFAEGILNLAAALDYFERSGQTALAAQVREDLQSYRQDAAPQDPWTTARLGENRYRFTNTSGRGLAQITPSPLGATHVQVEESPDSYTVPAPVDAGDTFVAVVRGRGLRVNATALPSLTYMYWDRRTKSRGGSHRPPLRDHAAAADADNTRLCWRTVTGAVDRPA